MFSSLMQSSQTSCSSSGRFICPEVKDNKWVFFLSSFQPDVYLLSYSFCFLFSFVVLPHPCPSSHSAQMRSPFLFSWVTFLPTPPFHFQKPEHCPLDLCPLLLVCLLMLFFGRFLTVFSCLGHLLPSVLNLL